MSLRHFNCIHSTLVTGLNGRPEYILHIKSSNLEDKLLLSASNHHLCIYDHELRVVRSHRAHNDTITAIEYSMNTPATYYSSSSDRNVSIWDSRASASSNNLRMKEEVNAMTVNPADNLLVVSQETDIIFYDLRSLSSSPKSPKPLGSYSDVHSDIVTSLRFSPSNPNVLLSSGEDGLVGLYALDAVEAEQAVLSILNTDCPVNQIGFFGGNAEGVYALSTIETATLWHFPSAQRIASFPSIRDQFCMDYLVDCIFDQMTGDLLMVIGNHEGHGQIMRVCPDSISEYSSITNYNESTIRCVCSPNRLNNTGLQNIITGGEDGRVNFLRLGDPPANGNSHKTPSSHDVGSVKVHVTKKDRFTPY